MNLPNSLHHHSFLETALPDVWTQLGLWRIWLLGNWMLNVWSDPMRIWSCSKCYPCRNDLLISILSSAALLSLLFLDLLGCLRYREREVVVIIFWGWGWGWWWDFKANYGEYIEQHIKKRFAWLAASGEMQCRWPQKTFYVNYHISVFKYIISFIMIKHIIWLRCSNTINW